MPQQQIPEMYSSEFGLLWFRRFASTGLVKIGYIYNGVSVGEPPVELSESQQRGLKLIKETGGIHQSP